MQARLVFEVSLEYEIVPMILNLLKLTFASEPWLIISNGYWQVNNE